MNLTELLTRNRSYRRFQEDQPLDEPTLRGLVEKTRLCPSSANRQPLKFLIAHWPEDRAKVFPHLAWAAALRDWPGPAEGQRPAGYIVVLGDTQISGTFHVDAGIAAQSILLAAVEQGLGGCMLGSINRDALHKTLNIPQRYAITLVIALGTPAETVALEDAKNPTDVIYWRDEQDIHHVPKRPLEELIVRF
jgi:nitroreductase